MNNTQTIVDLEAMIEPTRPSYKHLHIKVKGSVSVDIKTKTAQRRKKPHKTSITKGTTTDS